MVIAAGHGQNGGQVPPALLDALGGRWRALAASAAGRVLELPAGGVEEAVRAECSRRARYDTILSFMRTPEVADLDNFVSDLELLLADDGWILMIEPSGSGNGQRRRRRPGPDQARRDVVSALRAGGFTVADLHRRELVSAPARWRLYVEIRARRETPVRT
ncbi:MAG: hypothetical protein F4Z00_04170 [Acidimicrobiaceae bacterium]|nr:hypothetical protein [Acidimicrobiaceae bacterium]MXW89109.1 hypothetical protein [Acidimicrobiaceae bacterium]MXY10641.1 hypothetical protein [Acidimicrobiaceae bacterium]MXZ64729.1 hypothetical protein [Acidimicrobiaceae bacterium]MYA14666.1 hypothetical protein [Acidimicrobiaceae bacterium]